MWFSLGTFICFGLTNFILGWIAESGGSGPAETLLMVAYLALSMGVMGILFFAFSFGSDRFLLFFRRKRLILMPMGAGLMLIAGMGALKSGLSADPGSKAPIVALTAANSLIVALLARVIIGETLSRFIWIGFSSVLAGGLVMAFSSPSHATSKGIILGLISMTLFGLTNFILKYTAFQGGDPLAATILLWIASGIMGLVFLFLNPEGFAFWRSSETVHLLFLALAAGILLAWGMFFLKKSVSLGPAGPAAAVAGANAVLVAILDRVFFSRSLTLFKSLGMLLILIGIFQLAWRGIRVGKGIRWK